MFELTQAQSKLRAWLDGLDEIIAPPPFQTPLMPT